MTSDPRSKAAAAPEAVPPSDLDALSEIMLIQAAMHRQFLRVILRRIVSDLPSFEAELFLAELDMMAESLAEGRGKSAIHAFAYKEWERLSQMALDAVASTRAAQAPPPAH